MSGINLSILYRGPLSSCNYDCGYCPFAKHHESREEHARDAAALERFVSWAESWSGGALSILFTPWGEALIRRRYRQAMVNLSHLPHVRRVAIQTNLSYRLDWLEEADKSRIALWTTYHPSQTTRARFLARCEELTRRGVRFSVGAVGLRQDADEIEALRRALPSQTYLWINAFKDLPRYTDAELTQRFKEIDPLFGYNLQDHPSAGHACRTGESVISVDGNGAIRRCHFVSRVLGNLYTPGWESILRPRPCTRRTCNCHIGYVHMPELGLYETFGDGVLERAMPMPRLSP